MLDSLRIPLFIAAIILLACAVLLEVGSGWVLGPVNLDVPRPGLGISYLALIDGLILYIISLMAVALLLPERIYGRIQGVITFVVSLLVLLGSIAMIFIAIALVTLMVSLLLALPFGTVIYFGVYALFKTGPAATTLGLIMTLKLLFVGFLVFSQQRFLQSKSLVLIILTSLLANIIISFLHGLVPRFLVSITDTLGAIVVAILAAIWALFLFIGSIPAIIKALRVDRAVR
ncbi:MAG: hypothetical protein HY080_02760 [Gammaproteobacteria bacterium]|nr:hypothetical protein [Gammaproteobacteria bacterium]